ncbi:hypothetical protein SODALDRAFT_377190 [Sodiomyces alkalinus F11]|uniref:Uncharacterized protein n=1 Tax=Sodiomyces alkalinus (strain CBS 110278 / VKM F-3762 / F11) TaxID=1314773 RepID=A0A3N2Q4J2_SODAK|nr:hypothetical protein SODALDRAFT_377190 [Sodiomyces alkalinus F11]ROT41525.1 hypothetical protein SODALDRAFT_377190 [Sodiomyces alkalinus F11]
MSKAGQPGASYMISSEYGFLAYFFEVQEHPGTGRREYALICRYGTDQQPQLHEFQHISRCRRCQSIFYHHLIHRASLPDPPGDTASGISHQSRRVEAADLPISASLTAPEIQVDHHFRVAKRLPETLQLELPESTKPSLQHFLDKLLGPMPYFQK